MKSCCPHPLPENQLLIGRAFSKLLGPVRVPLALSDSVWGLVMAASRYHDSKTEMSLTGTAGSVQQASKYQESPRKTKPKKGPKRKVHEFRPFL